MTKLAHVERNEKTLSRRQLKGLINAMTGLTPLQLRRLPGMESQRVDMILAGAIVLDEILRALDADGIEAANSSLREGRL